MAFYRQDYSVLLFHPPGDLPDSGMELASPASPTWQADSLPLSHLGSPILLAETGQKLGYVIIGNSPLFRRGQWQPTPVLLPGKSHGRMSLVGCSPWGRKESDTTERLHFHFSLSCIGEWNGNPLQCSCLENPRDRGAWWAAAYGVAQSRTWLKWLSSSSSSSSFIQYLLCTRHLFQANFMWIISFNPQSSSMK